MNTNTTTKKMTDDQLVAMFSTLSPALKAQINKALSKPAPTPNGEYLCGCGGRPKGRRSRYLPGHDAKHASKLLGTARVNSVKTVQ